MMQRNYENMSMASLDEQALAYKGPIYPSYSGKRDPVNRRNDSRMTMQMMSSAASATPAPSFGTEPDVCHTKTQREATKFAKWIDEEDNGLHPAAADVLCSIAALTSFYPNPSDFSAISGDPTAQEGLAQYMDLWEPWLNKWYPNAAQIHVYRTLADRNFFFEIFPIVDDATRDRYVQTNDRKIFWNSYEFTAQAWSDTGAHTAGPIDRAEVTHEEQGFNLCEAGYELPIDFLTNPLKRGYYFGFVRANHLSVSMTIELRGIMVMKRRAAMEYSIENVNVPRDATAFRLHYQKEVNRMFGFNKKKGFPLEENSIKDVADRRGLGIIPNTVIVPPGTKFLMQAVRDDTRGTAIFAGDKTPVYGWNLYEASKYPFLKGGGSYTVNPLETCLGVGEFFTMGPKEYSEFAPENYETAFFETALPDIDGDWRWINPLDAVENSGLFTKDSHAFSNYAGDIFRSIYAHCCKERRLAFNDAAWQTKGYDNIPAVCSAGELYSVTPVYDAIVSNISRCREKYHALLNFIEHQTQKMSTVLTESQRVQHAHSVGTSLDDDLTSNIEDAISGISSAGAGMVPGASFGSYAPAPGSSGTVHFPAAVLATQSHLTAHALNALSGAPSSAGAGNIRSQFAENQVVPIGGGASGAYRMEGDEGKIYNEYFDLIMEVTRFGSNPDQAFAMLKVRLLQLRTLLTVAGQRANVTDATVRRDIGGAFEALGRPDTTGTYESGKSRADINKYGLLSGGGGSGGARYPLVETLMGANNILPGASYTVLTALDTFLRGFLGIGNTTQNIVKMRAYVQHIMGSNAGSRDVVELIQAVTDSQNGLIMPVLTAHVNKVLAKAMASIAGAAATAHCNNCKNSMCKCPVDHALVQDALGKCRPSFDFFKFCFQHNIPPPIKCMMLRQNRWRSAAAVWLVRGESTGFTLIQSLARLFDRAPMEFKLHAQTRLQFAVIIHNLRNLYLTPHALVSQYLGGLGTRLFYDLEDASQFRGGTATWTKDIFSFAVPLTFEPESVIDWFGRFSHADVSGSGNDEQFPTCEVYNQIWGRNAAARGYAFQGLEAYKNNLEVFAMQRLFGRGCQQRKRKGGKTEASRSVTPYGPSYYPGKLAMLAAMRDTVDDGFIRGEDRTMENVDVGVKGG